MELQQTIDKYYSRKKLADSICKYQLYYQIGLGSVVLESLGNLELTVEKIKKLNLQINSQLIITAINEIILEMAEENDFDKLFDQQLKNLAFVQMLSDFVNADKELINPKQFAQKIIDRIKNNTFFDYNMEQQFMADYKVVYPNMLENITNEVASGIKANMLEVYRLDQY